MKLLILGGTRFLGRHTARLALERGWTVTLLHRGRSGPGLFPEAEHLIADREGALDVLADRSWHAVIDCSGQSPNDVRTSVHRLVDSHYTFVSTISVYADLQAGADEYARLHPPSDAHYAGLKVACEQEVARTRRHCVVRPGLIVGPWDGTERFAYWVRRMQRPGPVLCPGTPDHPIQVIDARDLANFLLDGAQTAREGVFNAVGEAQTLGNLIDRCATGDSPRVWIPDTALTESFGLQPWSDLPLWLTSELDGFARINGDKARAVGLRCRSLAQTVTETRAWTDQHVATPSSAISPAREAEILAAWRETVADAAR